MFDARTFDDRYYQRFYLQASSQARAVAQAGRTADLIFGAARHYGVEVRRIVDLGAGTGFLLRAVARRFPRARCIGVEMSPWAAQRYGWTRQSLLDFEDATGFDLVICNDVLQYLDDADAHRAVDHIGALCRGMAYVTAMTRFDLEQVCDQEVSDTRGHFRSGAWYRRRLRRHFDRVGSGVHLKSDIGYPIWELEQL